MVPSELKHIEYVDWCLDCAAIASGDQREVFQRLAGSFQSCAKQIEKSMSLIAESKALMAETDRLIRNHRAMD